MKKEVFFIALLGFSLSSLADVYDFQTSYELSERYADNFRLLTTPPPQENFITTITPAINLNYLRENSELGVRFQLSQLIYSNESNLNATEKVLNTNYNYNWERYSFSLIGDYSEQSTITTEFGASGTGLVTSTTNIFRTSRNLSPSLSYNISESNSIRLSYSFNDASFDNRNTILRGFTSQQLSTLLSHRISSLHTISFNASYSLFDSPEVNQSSDTISAQINWQYNLNETTQLGFSIGQRNTNTDFLNGQIKTTTSGQIFSINLNKVLEWGEVRINAGQQLNPASTGQQQQSTTFSINGKYNLSERMFAQINANYLNNESTGLSTNGSNRTLTSFSPSLNWKLTEYINLGLSYDYREQVFQNPDRGANGNSLQVQISYQPKTNKQVK